MKWLRTAGSGVVTADGEPVPLRLRALSRGKNVGAPWLGRSVTSGSARQIARSRSERPTSTDKSVDGRSFPALQSQSALVPLLRVTESGSLPSTSVLIGMRAYWEAAVTTCWGAPRPTYDARWNGLRARDRADVVMLADKPADAGEPLVRGLSRFVPVFLLLGRQSPGEERMSRGT
jgi:hypothetical protein